MPNVAVIGAGIAGLTAAHCLRQAGGNVHVFEKKQQPGGAIYSEQSEGFLIEHGPNTVRSSTLLDRLIDACDLGDQRIAPSSHAQKRYVVRDGRLLPVPQSAWTAASTKLISGRAKLRLLMEPFQPTARASDESVASFVKRRLGPEVLRYAVDPFVAGVFAGAPEMLSVRHAFPKLREMEQQYGSLFCGALRARTSNEGAKRSIFSLSAGLQTLPRALMKQMREYIHLGTPVCAMQQKRGAWQLDHTDDTTSTDFDAVVYAGPLHALHSFDGPIETGLLPSVNYPPLTVLALGFRRGDVGHPLDGFGALVPAAENDLHVLGTVFSSSLFADRAPSGHVLITVFVGGARHPKHCAMATQPLVEMVRSDLAQLLDVRSAPTFTRRVDWANAIPQYNLGYGRVKRHLDKLEEQHPRLVWAGNYRNGVSVSDAAASGRDAAERLLRRL